MKDKKSMKSTKSKVTTKGDKIISSGREFSKEALKSYRQYQADYIKKKYRSFIIRLRYDEDSKLIEHMESKDNLSNYIKMLVEKDISK